MKEKVVTIVLILIGILIVVVALKCFDYALKRTFDNALDVLSYSSSNFVR